MTRSIIVADSGTPYIDITREFKATPEQLFRAHTDPDVITKWLGPRRLRMKIKEYDVRDGGRWRYTHTDEDGTVYAFHGVFHGTPSIDEGIVQTFEFEGMPGHVSLESLVFDEVAPGRTVIRNHSVYQSIEARNGMADSGMESGVNEGYDRLDELLESLAIAEQA